MARFMYLLNRHKRNGDFDTTIAGFPSPGRAMAFLDEMMRQGHRWERDEKVDKLFVEVGGRWRVQGVPWNPELPSLLVDNGSVRVGGS